MFSCMKYGLVLDTLVSLGESPRLSTAGNTEIFANHPIDGMRLDANKK